MDLEALIRDVPDFPKPGIIFKDITPLLADPDALKYTADQLAGQYADENIQLVTGIESRGFIFGSMIAERLDVGFAPIRKPGKLPAEKLSESYTLEYGTDTVEMHVDVVNPGSRVLMTDDLLATGGTMQAACRLVEKLQGIVVGASFVIELSFLRGREKLPCPVHSLIQVAAE